MTGSIANFFLSGTGGDLMRLRDNIFFGAGTGTGWGLLHSFWCMRGFVSVKFYICGKGVGWVRLFFFFNDGF